MSSWIVWAWIVTGGSVAGLAGILAWTLLRSRNFRRHESRESTGEEDSAADFSFACYRVMERLLAPQDLRFLSAQNGYHPATGARWKRNSLRIFRMYLRELTRDLFALHAHARQLVVESHTESPRFASTLVRQQTAFWRARAALEVRLILFQWGLRDVEVAPLLKMIEAMRADLLRSIPEAAQAL